MAMITGKVQLKESNKAKVIVFGEPFNIKKLNSCVVSPEYIKKIIKKKLKKK